MVVARDGEQAAHVVKKVCIETPAADFGASVAETLIAHGAQELLTENTLV
jgi:hypothetical protein